MGKGWPGRGPRWGPLSFYYPGRENRKRPPHLRSPQPGTAMSTRGAGVCFLSGKECDALPSRKPTKLSQDQEHNALYFLGNKIQIRVDEGQPEESGDWILLTR